uniref:Meiosis-specific nuclear structural protein 1 n=1 Tax=Leptocylindrus danicus TaxID=163516 RepID=A0A7S2KBW2_9STRA|eukprot:CAMPEP_0116005022 /NCGR_PEP_ID=MMETSP0321-20121206/933_1 /TAXON_ID=163516 /ORGANISM="Leptocylindrus danicus var. danicus, Strain B650" /LENGTH=475 /DNA_ID=CAMNT_0003473401 /DNA_START=2168 /DNA_END=3595 /DNA_ORIENTATION=-
MSAHRVELNTRHRRTEEQRMGDLLRYANESERLSQAAKNEARVAQTRYANVSARAANELALKEKASVIAREREENERIIEQNDSLAATISRRNAEKEKMEREIQRMIETSEELKELERNLQLAYINKERAAQHQEALLLRQIEGRREQMLEDQMEQDRQRAIIQEQEKENERRDNLIKQKTVLQNQISERQAVMTKSKDEVIQDKKLVDTIIAKINEEDRLEMQERLRKKDETRALVQQFQEEREKKKRELAEEERKQQEEIDAYQDMMNQRAMEEEANRKAMEEEKKRRWTMVVEETQLQTQTQDEYNDLRDLLWQEELEAKRIEEEKDRIARRAQLKEETMRQNQAQIAAKKELIAKQEEEEERLVQIMLEKFAADEEDERKRAETRFESKQRFVHQIRGQMEERARMFQMEKDRDIAERNASCQQEEYRRRVVAEARKRLLAKHASQLKGFLPKNALVDHEEVQILERATTN